MGVEKAEKEKVVNKVDIKIKEELEKLRADHAKIRAEIEEMMMGLNHEQVALYNQALTPEMRRITDKAQGRWGKEQLVNMSKVVNYSHKFSNTSVNSSVNTSSSRKSESSSSFASTSSANGKAILDESGIEMGMEDVVQEALARKSPSDKNKK